MAESSISVTEGSGKRLRTNDRTVSSILVQEQVIQAGEPYLPTYSVAVNPSTATATSHLLQIMAGASLNVRVRRIEIYPLAATTASVTVVQIVRLTTAGTGGTSVTPTPFNTGDAASGATAMTLPTGKGTIAATPLTYGMVSLYSAVPTSGFVGNAVIWDFDDARLGPVIIPAGTSNGLAIVNNQAIAGGTVLINVIFSETSF